MDMKTITKICLPSGIQKGRDHPSNEKFLLFLIVFSYFNRLGLIHIFLIMGEKKISLIKFELNYLFIWFPT